MNFSTIFVACIVAVVLLAIVVTAVQNKKKGKHTCSCGGNCGGCAMSGSCHGGETCSGETGRSSF